MTFTECEVSGKATVQKGMTCAIRVVKLFRFEAGRWLALSQSVVAGHRLICVTRPNEVDGAGGW